MREEIEWYRQMRNYHCSKLSILRNLINMVQHLATEKDLKHLIKSEQELNNVDRALFDAKVNRDKRQKPKEEKKQEQVKPDFQLKIDTENKKSMDPLKQKPEKIEPRGISTFFKPKEKTENLSIKSEFVILNPLLKGCQSYQTDAKKQQEKIKLSWSKLSEL